MPDVESGQQNQSGSGQQPPGHVVSSGSQVWFLACVKKIASFALNLKALVSATKAEITAKTFIFDSVPCFSLTEALLVPLT